ncbi:MAG: TonB family protein [Candidatus Sulfotelmatobacter sp.]
MSIPTERWKEWEGRLVDGQFALRKWLGGSDHSAVFLTECSTANAAQSVVKLITAEGSDAGLDANVQLLLWAETAKLLHPQLIRLYTHGRCTIDETQLLYVVMEYAEENLAEIIPVRPLSGAEALEVLSPATEAQAFLHRSGFVHSCIKPSNIVAVGNQLKLSSDRLRNSAQARPTKSISLYEAREVAISGFTPAADIWSLGATLISVLTQKEPAQRGPRMDTMDQAHDAAIQGAPERLKSILRQCMQLDPAKRPTADAILHELSGQKTDGQASALRTVDTNVRRRRPGRRIVLPVVVLAAVLLAVLIASKFMGHQPSATVSEAPPQNFQADNQTARSSTEPAPNASTQAGAPQTGVVRGSVLNRVMPDVSRNALHTIKGRIKVSVEVAVDTSGKVTGASLATSGPSRYFSTRSLIAARQWRFSPAQRNGEPTASEWILRFQFGRGSAEVFPTELKP